MKQIISIFRYIVGILFIFSGLVKANDPLGLAYKMQEFFEIWAQSGWLPELMRGMNDYALAFSIIMISFEIVAGVAVLVGWKMNLFSWLLLLLIIFFTFLTGYAYLSGKFRSCGCFGDCIPITPQASFIKDIFLTLLILVIFFTRKRITQSLSSVGSILIIICAGIFSLWLQWHVLQHLPIADCLPFKKGNNIIEKMKIPPGAIPDSTVISFVYEKQGKSIEFTAENFPEDFDDSLYHFVKRYDKVIIKGNAEPAIKDFVLTTISGNDTTAALLSNPGYTALLFVKDNPGKGKWLTGFNEVYASLQQSKIVTYIISNNVDEVSGFFNDMTAVTFLKCDVVPIKTAARANPTLYILRNGTIIHKWSYADFDQAKKDIGNLVR